MVGTFKKSISQVLNDKNTQAKLNASQVYPTVTKANVKKQDLNGMEKRKILETFVENDDALGLLLDFISTRHVQNQGQANG